MFSRIRSHVRSNLVGYIALCFAVGSGAAWAGTVLPRNSVGTVQLQSEAVTTAKLDEEAVTAAKVADQALTGKQIKEGTLKRVPSAARAARAGRANLATRALRAVNAGRRIEFEGGASDPAPVSIYVPGAHTVFKQDELTLTTSCVNAGGGSARGFVALTSSVHGSVTGSWIQWNNPGHSVDGMQQNFDDATSTRAIVDLTGAYRTLDGQWIYRNDARTVVISLRVEESTAGCLVRGVAVAAAK
jgi:hypothetical protein